MRYSGKDMTLREYFNARMAELNPVDGYRSETEFNILAEYESSCGIWSLPEIDFIESLGYTVKDICGGDREYQVVVESGATKRILLETDSREEAVVLYDAFNNGSGEFEDENGFVWDLYIDEV